MKGQQVGDEPWALLILMIKKKLNISSDNRLPTVYSKYIHVSICSIHFYLYFKNTFNIKTFIKVLFTLMIISLPLLKCDHWVHFTFSK